MGRMDDQIPDDVKQARVEELMLAQQDVAFAKAKAMVGQDDRGPDRPPRRPRRGRRLRRPQRSRRRRTSTRSSSSTATDLHAGQLVNVKVTDYQAYDLVAEVPRKKSRSLKVVTAASALTPSLRHDPHGRRPCACHRVLAPLRAPVDVHARGRTRRRPCAIVKSARCRPARRRARCSQTLHARCRLIAAACSDAGSLRSSRNRSSRG